ncbi:MAG: hypothetical protein M1587_03870 [Thaumarchaeota archaeon]|nr:hypothetical protein [Nitrososphaerota archaeon]
MYGFKKEVTMLERLQIGDQVRINGLDHDYMVVDIFPHSKSVRLQRLGDRAEMVVPMRLAQPFQRSKTMMQAIGDWLFGGSDVYLLSDPGARLKVRKINWDRESSDLEDAQGRLYKDMPWDFIEFWYPVEAHFPDDK